MSNPKLETLNSKQTQMFKGRAKLKTDDREAKINF
jgi:hypothetical protein